MGSEMSEAKIVLEDTGQMPVILSKAKDLDPN